ncbi:MAG: nuclear transport factor 2 family protein [Acidobacteriota bacterium]
MAIAPRILPIGVAVAICAIAIGVWWTRASGDEQAIRAQLEALQWEVNRSTAAGPESAAHAEQIGEFFTGDAVVELGKGAAPIVGRPTLIGMVFRLQPRTAAFRIQLDDVGVQVAPGGGSAEVTLTASFIQRAGGGDESRDVSEFALTLTRADNRWRIAKVTAVDTLR